MIVNRLTETGQLISSQHALHSTGSVDVEFILCCWKDLLVCNVHKGFSLPLC